LACFSKHIISALNLSHNQLVNPATLQPLVPPGCVGFSSVFDPGAEPYKTHLLNQLSAIMEHLSAYSGGIVIDRWDFAGLTNPRADDGVSAYVHPPGVTRAKALCSTSISLQEFMVAASAIVHEKYHRAISINDHTYRVDLLEHVDHAGDEHGGAADRVHAGSLAFMSKPVSLGRPPQELLYWGSMQGYGSSAASWAAGNPFGGEAMAYSPLFRQLQGKRWAGEAHAVRVTAGGPAQANLFVIEPTTKAARMVRAALVAQGAAPPLVRVLVVVLGPPRGNVTVELRGGPRYASATALHPGGYTINLSAPVTVGGVATLTVPLSHSDATGCAVVRLTPKAQAQQAPVPASSSSSSSATALPAVAPAPCPAQPCPSHHDRTYCPSDKAPGQCDAPMPHPPCPPCGAPPTPSAGDTIAVRLADAKGRWDGVGGLSSGGSTRLLADYPAQQRSDFLDLLFAPKGGAAFQILKTEVISPRHIIITSRSLDRLRLTCALRYRY
jgi:hypothetical protein